MLLSTYRLNDGTQLLVRPIRADDKRLLAKAFARLSPETVHKRFLGPKKRLSTAELKYLTEIDGSDHAAVVAVVACKPWIIVGVGRYVRLAEDPETADVAVVVGDPWQHQGPRRDPGAVPPRNPPAPGGPPLPPPPP